jgi:serine/threonine protein kinase
MLTPAADTLARRAGLQIDLDRPVALKVIAPHLAQDEAFRERFVAESRTAAAIDHPQAV